jgi:hypothetical protein
VIPDKYITALRCMRIAMDVVLQGPNIGVLPNVHVVLDLHSAAPAIDKHISVQHHTIPYEHVAAVPYLNAQQQHHFTSAVRGIPGKKRLPQSTYRNVGDDVVEYVLREERASRRESRSEAPLRNSVIRKRFNPHGRSPPNSSHGLERRRSRLAARSPNGAAF